jgi:hypothetical protein
LANLTKAQREDREKKEAQNIIKRGDRSYVEIEEFREYELSWAIAFEMEPFSRMNTLEAFKVFLDAFAVETYSNSFQRVCNISCVKLCNGYR